MGMRQKSQGIQTRKVGFGKKSFGEQAIRHMCIEVLNQLINNDLCCIGKHVNKNYHKRNIFVNKCLADAVDVYF
jgi:hypothetical protein